MAADGCGDIHPDECSEERATMGERIKRGDRDAGCRCHQFTMDLYEQTETDDGEVHGWYGPKCPHHAPVEITDG